MSINEMLFYGGIVVMAVAAVGAVVAGVILGLSGKRLKAKQEEEFGKKRHG